MKAVLIAFALVSTQAFASGAVEYTCLGKDALTGNAVAFDLLFADHAREAGYTNQSITIVKNGYETLEKPIVFQMYDATRRNNCQLNSQGEILLKTDLNMTPADGDIAAYTVTVKSNCAGAKFDIKAYCLFQ